MSQSAYSIAAVMLGGQPCDGDRLHHELYMFLSVIEDYVELAGGEVTSRQAVAVAVAA